MKYGLNVKPLYDADDGGTGGGDDPAKGIAAALAAKAAADAAAAKKVEDDAAAAAAKIEADKQKSGLSDDAAKLLKENMKAKADKAALELKLKEFEGIDPVAIRKLLADQEAAKKKELEDKGEWERLKTMMASENAAAVKKAETERDAERAEREKRDGLINTLTVGAAFSSSKFLAGETVLPPSKARAVYGAYFDVEDGEVVAYDKPKGSTDRTKYVDAQGEPLDFEEAIKRIVEADPDRDSIKRSKLALGAGSGSNNDGKGAGAGGGKAPALKGLGLISAALAARTAAKK